jgi:hypothetical protein
MANEIQFKLVLLGNMSVGKTSMALRFVRNQFFEYQENTIGGGRPTPAHCTNSTSVLVSPAPDSPWLCVRLQRHSSQSRWCLTTRRSSLRSGIRQGRSGSQA